ncbi:MAG: DNA/RNA nuclease SfsA [Pseudomonadota bacterium]
MMDQPARLEEGVILKRYKRFFLDVRLKDGREVTAHCPNPGALPGLCDPGLPVFLAPATGGKLAWRWELVRPPQGLVAINTMRPNGIVHEAITAGRIAELAGYDSIRREVRYGERSRIDLLLESPDRPPCYLEVKNVNFRRPPDPSLWFPDCVSARAAKHMAQLAQEVRAGHRAVVLFLAQRMDGQDFRVARDIDPAYGEAFDAARAAGVEALCYDCHVTLAATTVRGPVPVRESVGS